MDIEATLNKMLAQDSTAEVKVALNKKKLLGEPTCKTVVPQISLDTVKEPNSLATRIPNNKKKSMPYLSVLPP